MKRRIKTIYLILALAITFILGVVFILWANNTNNTTIPLILVVIDFLLLTTFMQALFQRIFKYKPKKVNYIKKVYKGPKFDELDMKLKTNKFKSIKTPYGECYNLIANKTIYKVVLIEDSNKYFNQDQTDDKSMSLYSKSELEKCLNFVGVEIFKECDNNIKEKIVDFAFDGKNIFYQGLYYDADNIIEENHIDPKGVFIELYNELVKMLEIEQI